MSQSSVSVLYKAASTERKVFVASFRYIKRKISFECLLLRNLKWV